MIKEEREKAINALKMSVPIYAMTQEEFNDYIQTLNKIMDWLEQEPITKNNTVDFNKINELADFAIKATGQRDSYSQGMCNGIEYLRASLTDTEPKYFDSNDEYKEPTSKNDLGVDAISRDAVLELIADYDFSMGQVVRGIHALHSVTPQEPLHGKCNQCKYYDGVHNVQGHAPCSYHKIGGVMWNWYCSQFESEVEK